MQQRPPERIPFVQAAAPLLQTGTFGRSIRGYSAVPSTNTYAAVWAGEGAPEGSVVFAELQTTGRGRLGRSWTADPGRNLTFSVILRPPLAPDHLGLITVAAAVAVADTVEGFAAPARVEIKWPNDILLNGRKCCGMLLESNLSMPSDSGRPVILGIGLNVNQDTFPDELSERATSLLLETGRMVDRPALFAALLLALETRYRLLCTGGAEPVRAAFTARLAHHEQRVTYRLSESTGRIQGTVTGIDDTGALLLRTRDGLRAFHAGEITTQLPDVRSPE
ncbi:MAG TPA: biotin--[acetyl-CoA-carboxylase] ligase [Rhodothermales bacterium]|nr:biotin--[acetyl-CoA-carboxylase] ligase [Rhodothermales bacterium]